MHIYVDPGTGRKYTVGPDGTTRWLTASEELQYARSGEADPFPGGPAGSGPETGAETRTDVEADLGTGTGTRAGAETGPGHARVPAAGANRLRWGLPVATGVAGLVLGGLIGSSGGDGTDAVQPFAGPATVTSEVTVPAGEPATVTKTKTVKAKAKKAKTSKQPVAQPTTKTTPAAPKTDPRFPTCGEANDAGYGPYTQGVDPEYDWYRDGDGDGFVCET